MYELKTVSSICKDPQSSFLSEKLSVVDIRLITKVDYISVVLPFLSIFIIYSHGLRLQIVPYN
jgi:hypothetical protein